MDAATMTTQVADAGEIERDVAERAIEATLRTLAHRITGPEAHDLASQLPVEFQGPLEEEAAASEQGEQFDADEFLRRVGDEIGSDQETTRRAVQGVFDTIGASITSGEWGDLLSQLPNDYEPLFSGQGPTAFNS